MAGSIQLKKGTKMQLAFDVPVGLNLTHIYTR